MHPDDRVNNGIETAAEMLQSPAEMLACDFQLTFECRTEHRLTVFEALDARDRRVHEIARPHTQRSAVRASQRIVALNHHSTARSARATCALPRWFHRPTGRTSRRRSSS